MTLPHALVDRWPAPEYQQQHTTIESALKHSISDLLSLHKELKILRQLEKEWYDYSAIPDDLLTKDIRNHIKRQQETSASQELTQYIIALNSKFDRCLKNTDYPAMIMAAYSSSRYYDKGRFKTEADDICKNPVLLRGISSGKIINAIQKRKQDYYFIETGYLGNYRCENNQTGRKIYHRIVKNAMQHNTIMDVPDDRWNELIKFNPALEYKGWKRTGSKILIVLSTDKPFQYYNEDKATWLQNTIDTLKKYTDREIVIREKASRGERTNDTMYDALDDDVYALVTYNSIAAVEAIQYGIPAFALAPTAADPVGNKDLSMIEYPNMPSEYLIQKWLHSIAYSQFSLDEIITGDAWRLVLENAERPTLDY